MNTERWVMGAGGIVLLIVFAAALAPDSILMESKGSGSPMSGSQADALAQQGAPPAGGEQAWGRKTAIPGLIPFSQAKTERFGGTVVRTASMGQDTGWDQIHIWIDAGGGASREVSVAPQWFLQHLGCPIKEKSAIQGVGFRFDKVRPNAELYAKSIAVDGNSCRLRNDEGFALWSNQLR